MHINFLPNTADIRDIGEHLLDAQGNYVVPDASYMQQTTVQERALFGHKNGLYFFPTHEALAFLKGLIAGRSCIEVGSGAGHVAKALGIPATDNKQMSWPHVAAHYEAMGQPITRYGDNVQELGALDAVQHHRPDVVLGCWVTHLYDPARHWAGGNQWGIDEAQLIEQVQAYILVGNMRTHKNKPIWDKEHVCYVLKDILFSRASSGDPDFVAVFQGGKAPRVGPTAWT